MMLVNFGGLQVDVEGMSETDLRDLEEAERRLRAIERLKEWQVVGPFFVGLLGFMVAAVSTHSLKSAVVVFAAGLMLAGLLAIGLMVFNDNAIYRLVTSLHVMYTSRDGRPCKALISMRVFRSAVLTKAMKNTPVVAPSSKTSQHPAK